jgi:hypothetical protein
MAKADVNWDMINKKLDEAFKDTVFQYTRQATLVISRPRFWEGYNDVRDIVDTGQLRASQRVTFETDSIAHVDWLTEYAAAVANGATIKHANGSTHRIPPRPFPQIAAAEMRLEETLARNIKAKFT